MCASPLYGEMTLLAYVACSGRLATSHVPTVIKAGLVDASTDWPPYRPCAT